VKIAVCGKGGSGKSTLVALLAHEISNHGYEALVVDSDESNTGLYKMLGFENPPVSLMEMLGGKTSLKGKMAEPNIFKESEILPGNIPKDNIREKEGVSLVAIGKILQSLEGCACPMGY
jgi:CO dehydrogenase maturation factor